MWYVVLFSHVDLGVLQGSLLNKNTDLRVRLHPGINSKIRAECLITKICSITFPRQSSITASKIRPDLRTFNMAKEGMRQPNGGFSNMKSYIKRELQSQKLCLYKHCPENGEPLPKDVNYYVPIGQARSTVGIDTRNCGQLTSSIPDFWQD